MNAVTTKPRAPAKRKPKTETPASVAAVVRAALRSASDMLDQARDIGEQGDFGERAMRYAHDLIAEAVEVIEPTSSAMFNANDILFDAEGILCGVAAMHKGDGRGVLCQCVIDQIEAVYPEFDRQKFWPDEPEAPAHAPATESADTEGNDEQQPEITESPSFEQLGIDSNAYLMIGEVIAIIRARAEDLGSDFVYGAMYLTERAEGILSDGVKSRDLHWCEDASAPLAVAICVLEKAVQECDDLALHGALRLLELSKVSLDDAIAGAK